MQINNRIFKYVILKLSRALTKSNKWTLVGFAIIFIFSLLSATRLKSFYDLNDLVDKDFKTYSSLQLLNNEFDDKNMYQLIFIQKNWTELDLCKLRKIITEFYIERNDIKRLSSTFGLKKFVETEKTIQSQDLIQLNCRQPTSENKNSELEKIKNTPWNKILNSTNALDVIVQIGLADNDKNGRFGEFDPYISEEIDLYFIKKMQENGLTSELKKSGLVTFKYYLKKGYQVVQALNGLSLFICLFIFWFFYRSLMASFIFITSVIITTVIVYGGMAAAGHSIDMLSNALPLMLTMSCLEDFIFFCHFRSNGYGLKKTLQKIILPTFLTSLTTAIGFGSLVFSELSIIRRFGAWAAFGGMVEWCILFLIFPAVLKTFPSLNFNVRERKLTFNRFRPIQISKWFAYAAIPISLWASTQIRIDDSPDKIFPQDHPIQNYIKWFEENKGWTADFSILSENTNIIFQAKIDEVLAQNPEVVAFESPSQVKNYLVRDISPSFHKSIQKSWTESQFSRRLISENDITRRIVYIKNTSVEAMTKLTNQLIHQICTTNSLETCLIAGSTVSYAEFGSRILKTLLDSFLLSLFLVSLVILLFRTTNLKTTFYLILSSIWGPLMLIIFFGLFKIPVFYVTSICASLLVGLAGDNAIQFMYFSKNIHSSVSFLQNASLKIAIGMILFCMVLFASPFTPLVNLGGIFILSIILLYIGDVFIFKSLLAGPNDKS
jgi:predicted RND superfamily exporter protein